MRRFIIAALGAMVWTGAAWSEEDAACAVAAHLASADFALPHVAAAVANKRLDVVVVGSASSTLGGPAGSKIAYPPRLEAELVRKLPGVAVKVTTYTKARETAAEMEKRFGRILADDKPTLVVWQTGTVEAMRRIDPDQFNAALDEGIIAINAGQSDVVLMNMQYSPRTESMISTAPYADTMRIVALQHEILLFDRFAIMKHWSELGTFDFNEVTKKIDTAERVHDCIGRLLGDLVVTAAKTSTSNSRDIH